MDLFKDVVNTLRRTLINGVIFFQNMNVLFWIFGSVFLVSLVSVIAAIPLLLKKKAGEQLLMFLLSISAGTLLGTVFFHFMPEMLEHEGGYTLNTGLLILAGFFSFFLLEKFIHWHHGKKCEHGDCHDHHMHAYHLAPLNLVGDGFHNFIDGLVIAGSFLVSIPLGIAATIAIVMHELPQEIADFGVLLYSGLSKKKALLFNFMSAAVAMLGALLGVLLSGMQQFSVAILPFAAGNFLYIGASNLVPELHRHCGLKDTLLHIFALSLGVGLMIALMIFSGGHGH